MKKFPITLIPLSLVIILACLFIVVVPNGGDLISSRGDYVLGKTLGEVTIVCVIIDLVTFVRNKLRKKSTSS